jgi:hypothetical protein
MPPNVVLSEQRAVHLIRSCSFKQERMTSTGQGLIGRASRERIVRAFSIDSW